MKNRNFVTSLYEIGVYIIDILLIILSIYLAYVVKFSFNIPKFNFDAFVISLPAIIIVYLVFMFVYGLGDVLKQSLAEMIYSVLLTVITLLISTMAISFFLRAFSYPRTVIVISSVIQFLFLSMWRSIVWKLKRRSHGRKPTIVIGGRNAERLAKKLLLKQLDIYDVKYICDINSVNLWSYIEECDVVFLSEDANDEFRNKIIDICIDDRKSLYIIPRMYEIGLISSKLNRVDDVPVLKVKKLGLTIEQRILKRTFDIVISLIGIIISSPIMLFVALAIKLQDNGPILYKQERVTYGEETFNIYKFRTMIKDAEKVSGPVIAGEDDPRITKLGKILRSTRLDELPQLFNVLAGSMSIVGPRPERPFFVNKFKTEIQDYKYRTLVKAGLTGLAQVLGKYNTTAEDKVKYDIIYIRNYSFLLDLKLIVQTVKIVFMKESTEGLKQEESLEEILVDLNVEITVDRE